MRIILKPAGAATILLAFVVLSVLLFVRRNGSDAVRAADVAGAPTPATSAGTPNLLQNAGLDGDFQPVQPYDNKATLSGMTAAPWRDDSSWAHVTVDYAQDTAVRHSGASAQRIEVHDVQESRDVPNTVQFIQEVKLPAGNQYAASVWVRADRPTQVELALRQAAAPFTSYGNKIVSVGTDWQQIRIEGTVTQTGSTFLLLHLFQPTRLWVDDASLVRLPG